MGCELNSVRKLDGDETIDVLSNYKTDGIIVIEIGVASALRGI